MIRRLPALFATLVLLSGCSGLQRVDSTVSSFARWDATASGTPPAGLPQPPQRYRFESLPSQRDGAGSAGQDTLEALTRTALAARGWTHADTDAAGARWTVQVSARSVRTARESPWNDPWGVWHMRGHVIASNGRLLFSPMFAFPVETPGYRREVALLIRETGTGRVVYETRAEHDSHWNASQPLWQAMLEAALRDFPAPPQGMRRVHVEVPR